MRHRDAADSGKDEAGDAKPDKHKDVGCRQGENTRHLTKRDIRPFHSLAPLDKAEKKWRRDEDQDNPYKVEQRHHIILVDHLAGHDDGFGLATRHTAQDGKAWLVAPDPPQEGVADGGDHHGGANHGYQRDHPFVGLCQNRLVESGADQDAKTQYHGLVKPAGNAKVGLQRPDQGATEPDPEQASHQIGGRRTKLHEGPSRCQRQRKGHGDFRQVGQQPGWDQGARYGHFNQALFRLSG